MSAKAISRQTLTSWPAAVAIACFRRRDNVCGCRTSREFKILTRWYLAAPALPQIGVTFSKVSLRRWGASSLGKPPCLRVPVSQRGRLSPSEHKYVGGKDGCTYC